tara:strand:+ start:1039 stop:1263 length:225 start_codon:yes stop_codon:yes gene_type:complete
MGVVGNKIIKSIQQLRVGQIGQTVEDSEVVTICMLGTNKYIMSITSGEMLPLESIEWDVVIFRNGEKLYIENNE